MDKDEVEFWRKQVRFHTRMMWIWAILALLFTVSVVLQLVAK